MEAQTGSRGKRKSFTKLQIVREMKWCTLLFLRESVFYTNTRQVNVMRRQFDSLLITVTLTSKKRSNSERAHSPVVLIAVTEVAFVCERKKNKIK